MDIKITDFSMPYGKFNVIYHHGMAHPRVADREDGLQIRRTAANILNKQSRRAENGWPSNLGVGGRDLKLLAVKKKACYEMLRRAWELDSLERPKL